MVRRAPLSAPGFLPRANQPECASRAALKLPVLTRPVITVLRRLDVFALTMAMTAMGIETRFTQIRKAGPRVLILGVLLYAWLLFGGYAIVGLAA